MVNRRTLLYATLVAALLLTAALYWVIQRPVIVPRPGADGPHVPRTEDLVGRRAAPIRGTDQNGQSIDTASLQGRVFVVNIWASWCPPCREELPRLEKDVWQRFGRDVLVVGVAAGEKAGVVRAYQQRAPVSFPLLPDDDFGITRHWGGRSSIPRTYVVGKDGRVAQQCTGYSDQAFERVIRAVELARRRG